MIHTFFLNYKINYSFLLIPLIVQLFFCTCQLLNGLQDIMLCGRQLLHNFSTPKRFLSQKDEIIVSHLVILLVACFVIRKNILCRLVAGTGPSVFRSSSLWHTILYHLQPLHLPPVSPLLSSLSLLSSAISQIQSKSQ